MEPRYLIVVVWGLLLVVVVLVVLRARRRRRNTDAAIASNGWQRLPDGSEVTTGWDGWPFLEAREPGRASDVLRGSHAGVEFLSLTWRQSEAGHGSGGRTERERYNIVALRCELDLPHLTVVRGNHKVHRSRQHAGATEIELGERGFDHRWQILGDAVLAQALLTSEVRAVMDDLDGAWVFQPGWVTRVLPVWGFFSGEERMVEELQRTAAPWARAPYDAWSRYGGVPAFVTRLGGVPGREG